MSIQLPSTELSSAEVSFLNWQYGFDDADAPIDRRRGHSGQATYAQQ